MRQRQESTCAICPATTEARLHGVHDGENAGRACWVVAGTLCDGEAQGTFAAKIPACTECDFHGIVQRQEGAVFAGHEELTARLS